MRYQVQFLDDDTFEALPYRDMHEKVGVADPKTMRAFVRKSGLPILDSFNAAHELEHLEDGHQGVHADHYDPEHGVYYKGFGNILAALAPIALSVAFPGIGTALGGALGGFGSALSGAGSSIAGALGSVPGIGGALGGAASSIGGALGGAGNALGGALGVGGGSANAGYAANAGQVGSEVGGAGIGSGTAAGSAGASAASAGGLGGALNSFGGAVKGASNILGGANSLMSAFGSQQGQMPDYNFGNGSYDPNASQSIGVGGPNSIAGASGAGSGGGPGGSPGSVGGGQVSKIKQQLESENTPNAGGFNGGMK